MLRALALCEKAFRAAMWHSYRQTAHAVLAFTLPEKQSVSTSQEREAGQSLPHIRSDVVLWRHMEMLGAKIVALVIMKAELRQGLKASEYRPNLSFDPKKRG